MLEMLHYSPGHWGQCPEASDCQGAYKPQAAHGSWPKLPPGPLRTYSACLKQEPLGEYSASTPLSNWLTRYNVLRHGTIFTNKSAHSA